MNILFTSVLIVALVVVQSTSKLENDFTSKKFTERKDILTVDPRYEELKKEAENIVKNFVNNVTIETASLMNKIITSVDLLYIKMESSKCAEAKKKLIELKGSTLKGFGKCPERQKVEEGSWALAILSAALGGDIQRAADDSLSLCMKQNGSRSVICRINPDGELSKRFDILKKKVDDLAMNASLMYAEAFQPFVENCFNENIFKSELETIKANCTVE